MLAYPLPANPSLEQLHKQAKEVRDRVRSGDPVKSALEAREMAVQLHPRWMGVAPLGAGWVAFTLADAQLVVARWYGFPSWRRLRDYVAVVDRFGRSPQRRPVNDAGLADEFLRLACLTHCSSFGFGPKAGEEGDDPRRRAEARRLLAAHPELASASIHTAAAVGDVDAARVLLAGDRSLAEREGGPHGWPPLLYLTFSRLNSTEANHSTLEVARLLLVNLADPNAGYLPDGQPPPVTALSGAFRGYHDPVNQPAHPHRLALARLLLDAGADPNDARALQNVCGYPHDDDDAGLSLLLEYGLGRPSGGPWRSRLGTRLPTPAQLIQDQLRHAAGSNLVDRARLLLRRCAETGIDIDAPREGPDAGTTAYELAMIFGNTEIVDLLTPAGAQITPLDPTFELVGACMRGDRPAVDRLLAADPGLAERTVHTPWWPDPLTQAAALNRPNAIELLVSVGFPVNDGKVSALHIAALTGHLDVVRLLVDLGSDPTAEAVSDTPGTPVQWARYTNQQEVIAYLTRVIDAAS
ncbi:MAG TPA: ankyrin repeat domain-containing protein [Actinophytocola sp.]|uniref:ankyrin repeat domain-containing protein n=1 Tax=Actinophytocola sp. TaxID=1872138 RepID=UPI002DBB79B9|nr:ankyrin repeat domain-containing protein [Actinophytocola sp.]HEU5474492.1 ankyrin repeat domain-containing protein [Actinophytocola sp.]